ncbi:aminodeoxychorismate/anthranilate synthase component II [Bacillus sp. JJ1609]|uniref:anthranilate synthase component II n=1 Tax=Bacillus sp. JJ1609 TaxID=3122977 RepID=UPI0030008FB1
MILLIDNYDSFTFNLYQYLSELGSEVTTVRNDKISLTQIEQMAPDAIVLSPGPGRPEQAGICVEVIRRFAREIPILGICLGHQAIGYAFGGSVIRANKIMHGKLSKMKHNDSMLFKSLHQHIEVMRYHSLVIERKTLPECLDVLAESMDDHEIMAIKHKRFPLFGLQFHPESIGTNSGKQILKNFLDEIRKGKKAYEILS